MISFEEDVKITKDQASKISLSQRFACRKNYPSDQLTSRAPTSRVVPTIRASHIAQTAFGLSNANETLTTRRRRCEQYSDDMDKSHVLPTDNNSFTTVKRVELRRDSMTAILQQQDSKVPDRRTGKAYVKAEFSDSRINDDISGKCCSMSRTTKIHALTGSGSLW